MSLLVVGSVALDSVITPTDHRENVLGGSAVFFAYAASYFSPVRMVGAVGEDWPAEHTRLLSGRNIDTSGLSVVAGKQTFRWRGKYHENMNDRDTLEVHLNVFGEFDPVVPEPFRDSQYVFLANGVPEVQIKVLDQIRAPKLVVADTMDLWIVEHHDRLRDLLGRLDGLVLNDSEAVLLTQQYNLVRAAQMVRKMGPGFVIIKKGEHGAVYCDPHRVFALPGYPTPDVIDPTGAGDSFAGGMMGYLASIDRTDDQAIKQALVYGTLVASFNVEDFSLDRMKQIDRQHIDQRLDHYRRMLAV